MSTPQPTHPAATATRARLIAAMADALQRRGLHGVGLNELLAQAQAPKGVLYHHFPSGKSALAVAAIQATVARLMGALDLLTQAPGADPVLALRAWMAAAQAQLACSGFERGCPLATVALESTGQDTDIRQALAQGFAQLRDRLARFLATGGVPPERARRLAALVVSAYEGALIQARVAGNVQALADTSDALLELLQTELRPNPAR